MPRPTFDIELQQMIASFDRDPADTDYQRGYLAALKEVQRMRDPRAFCVLPVPFAKRQPQENSDA
jgi:hypothetical protein